MIVIRMAQGGPGEAGEPTFNEGTRFSRQRRRTTRRIDNLIGPQSARSSFSRGQLPGKSRKYAVTDRSDSLESFRGSFAAHVDEHDRGHHEACTENLSTRSMK